ncbi:cdp-diacylglycerol-inositol 3-phosphatidyltransferase [Drepanopeziza brunnea f. sp. 'multigermtubi' MB_m1]|uniref:Cdp-diacylglycerol-inositol 3-phosphatidyltransferase n=1 Tax=Marssonina brunnea f. sp. multigermtubi (strain MB_m1) TaxID=1072389 RepID=K1WM85_MARBU|nr:cdp-diacylglycerol-inositol 3-phosphatidyltransferase [Drepanopeziza brunnea f. sp. 'multigermtubi' MB_m1]EKD13991.1 cdp-diacylglycerol-inositol 3-phosphatidyltransferase [Drepanopeziza brunnea f. sp. 'multigermtubi' MB_m1]
MSSVRTRRQAAAISTPSTPTPAPKGEKQVVMNGNGSAHAPAKEEQPHENIFLFYPNVIGYVRIVLAFASLYYMPLHPRTCSLLYSISCLLDALDGYAARYFEQSTRFGAVLDMVTDRCTTACLLVFLSSAWPRWALLFQGLISLDLASHYVHMYASLVMGGTDTSHKKVDKSRSYILNLYYTNKAIFFIALYLLSFSSPLLSPSLLQVSNNGTGASGASLQPGNPSNPSASFLFANPHSAGALELARANKMDSFIPWVIAGVSFPVMFGKQIINVVQLVKASNWLAEGDMEMRRAAGLPRKKKVN